MSESVGVVVPAFRPDVDTLSTYVRTLAERLDPDEIRVELDAPEPGVESTLTDLPATVHAVAARRGKGAAITCGFERLDTDVRAFADADGSTPADSMERVVDALFESRAGLSVGSRRHPAADVRSHQTLARRRMGDAFAWAARRLLDAALYDYQCGAKAITREAWEAVRAHLYEPGFAWDVELVAMTAALEYPVAEVPVTWEDQPNSTVAPVETATELARALLRCRHRAKELQGNPIHVRLAARRGRERSLVDRLALGEE